MRESLGRYRIEAEIGRGAMGVVYRAQDPNIERVVAIKTISLTGIEESQEQEYRERFAQEARAAGKLAHPGIVTVFDAGEDPETHEPFFVMEHVAGRPLSDEIAAAGGRLPLSEALKFGCEIADALHYAHSQGVIHGDIKPANILITTEGKAKIADFGVAHLNQTVATQAGKVFGSPAYMAPEQMNGSEPDVRSDLFSLGVTLYSMLTGFRPFQGNSAQTVCFKVMNVEPLPVSSLQADLPPELDRIVQRAIAKDPKDRYQNGAELAADLRAFASNQDSSSDTTGFLTRVLEQDRSPTRRPVRLVFSRRMALEAAIAVVTIALVLTGLEFRDQYREAETLLPPPPPVLPAPEIQKTPPESMVTVKKPVRRTRPLPVQTAKVRVEILHRFPNGTASVWLDKKLVFDQELRASTQGHGLFKTIVMNQTSDLQFSSGEHELEVRVVSPGLYDQTESLQANLTAGAEHVLYVDCDRKKMRLSLHDPGTPTANTNLASSR
jgi:serine/threonine protein kinase